LQEAAEGQVAKRPEHERPLEISGDGMPTLRVDQPYDTLDSISRNPQACTPGREPAFQSKGRGGGSKRARAASPRHRTGIARWPEGLGSPDPYWVVAKEAQMCGVAPVAALTAAEWLA